MRVITLLLILLLVLSTNAFAEPNSNLEIDLSTEPYSILFHLNNIKPGDSVTRELIVENNGSKDFKYLFTNRFMNGSEKLYNELLLNVSVSKSVLFEGKLKDFEKLDSRPLKTGSSEELTFRIEIPYELGNEFQGLNSEFQFKLYVEGTLGGVLPVDNKLPNTATEIFNFIVIGAGMFSLGTLIFFYQKRKKRVVKTKTFKEKVIGP
ncbi:TasA family protein [Sutcliffiella deserti]|uniref:TasA family protein n=1 Tax=Sutcliffiella deserti TaxID=2875501 RepID=UPI001CC0DEFF|nr:TasA family protein [Sutcliffiella deserti]